MAKIPGRNPVLEALAGPRQLKEIYLAQNSQGEIVDKIIDEAERQGVKVIQVEEETIADMAETSNPQGVVALGEELKNTSLDKALDWARQEKTNPRFLLLDQIQDPYNMGALIRTAQSANMAAVIYPKHRSCQITPTVVKASAGAVEWIKLCQVTNLNRAIEKLKEGGCWIAGAEAKASQYYYQADLKGSLGLVIGNEGRGLRRLVRDNCDFLLSIPVAEHPGSLNASVAAGIIIYETVRQNSS